MSQLEYTEHRGRTQAAGGRSSRTVHINLLEKYLQKSRQVDAGKNPEWCVTKGKPQGQKPTINGNNQKKNKGNTQIYIHKQVITITRHSWGRQALEKGKRDQIQDRCAEENKKEKGYGNTKRYIK